MDIENSVLNFRVQKSNKLINSKQEGLTATQNKILLIAANRYVMAQNGELDLPTDERGRQYVPLFPRDFFGGEKVNGRALQQIKEQLGDLTGISVFLRIQTEEMEEERRIPIASAVRGYRDRKTKKTVEGKEMQVSLSPEIVEMFIKQWDKGNFTQYLYEKVRDFRVGSAFKLYEVLLQHLTKNRLQHGQVKFSVEMLGEMLARGSYRNKKNGNLIYSEFKRNVLAKSINDINSNDRCDLEVTSLEEKRLGRKVQDVFFHVRYKQGRHFKADSAMKDPEVGELSVVTDQLVEKWVRALVARFKRIGRSNWHQLVLQLKNEYDNDRIEKNIDYLLCQQQRIKNPQGYLRTAIKENYAESVPQTELFAVAPKATKAPVYEAPKPNLEKREWEVHKERIAEEFNQYWKDLCFQYYNQLGEDCLDDYLEYLQNEAPALERKSLSSWEMQTPSEEAIRFFGRYLIKNFGTPQERLYQVKGLKAYAKKVYQFDVDAF